jgi:hypothetical protein
MARKAVRKLIDDPAVNASFTSDVIPAEFADILAVEFNRTGTIIGVVSLEASISGENWAVVPDSVNTVDSTVQTYIIELRVAASSKYRITYAHTAGLGEVSVYTYIKGS